MISFSIFVVAAVTAMYVITKLVRELGAMEEIENVFPGS